MTNNYSRSFYFTILFKALSPVAFTGRFSGLKLGFVFCFSFLLSLPSFSQDRLNATVDTNTILIGDQVSYKIIVETREGNLVVFPEGASFNPMEVVESFTADTSRLEDRFRLIKEYALTQFDSGSYTIPRQQVLINERPYFTDSIQIEVNDVVVDTTKQKMYAIKPAMEVPSGFSIPVWLWILIGLLLVAAIIWFLLRRRKKKLEAQKQLPPYERALFELQQLDQSHLLENRQTKEYYSKLTEAVRRYLEDEVHLRAMESTTSEVIQDLENKMATGELKLSRQTIDELKIILQRADLAKFANSRPDVITAKGDRSKIEHVIIDTKAAIPEPTEEELLKDEAYRREQLRKKNRRKVIMAVGAGIIIIAIGITVLISTQGFSSFRNLVLGNPTKELLQGEWITSEYGDPSVTITTPRVLKRGEIELPQEAKAMMVGSETFMHGELDEDLYVMLNTVRFKEGVKLDLKAAVEGIYANLENQGAKNIIVKDEEFNTLGGARGIKVFGSLEMENPATKRTATKEYLILNFAESGGFQQITIIYDEDDEYAEEIAGRIINSVEFENDSN